MDLRNVQYVQEIVRCGSMTKAADNLYLSQSALSQSVSRLERNLGAALFRREGGRLSLTREGEIFLREGGNILSAYENMVRHIRRVSSAGDDTVHLGISSFYGQYFLPELFPLMREEMPGAQLQPVQETSSILLNLVREHLLDFCVAPFQEAAGDLSFEYLCTEEIMAALPSDCPALSEALPGDGYPSLDVRALRDYPFLMMEKGQLFAPMGYRICASAGFEPRIACELRGWNSIACLVAAGVGVAFLPREMALKKNDAISFCHIIAPAATTRPVMIVTAKDRELSFPAESAVRLLKRIVAAPGFLF